MKILKEILFVSVLISFTLICAHIVKTNNFECNVTSPENQY